MIRFSLKHPIRMSRDRQGAVSTPTQQAPLPHGRGSLISPAASSRDRHARSARRGGVYPLVLIVSATASAAVLTGLAVRQETDQRCGDTADLADARLLARAGVEAALQTIEENSDWRRRSTVTDGWTITAGTGKIAVAVADTADGDVSDDETDPVRITASGLVGDASADIRVDLMPVITNPRDVILAAGPIRFWPLDETSGYTADDLTGTDTAAHSNTAYLNRLTGPDGGPAPLMNSTSSYVWNLHSSDMLLAEGTIMCWVYHNGATSGDQTIFAKTNNSGGEGELVIALTGTKNLGLTATMIGPGGATETLRATRINAATWTHVAISFGPDGLHAFVDGTWIDSLPTCTSNWASPGNHDLLFVGVFPQSLFTRTEPLNGSVRDVVIFDRQLNEQDIAGFLKPGSTRLAIDPNSWAWVTN